MDWLEFENEAYEKGYEVVCGVDEAGRGPLAGPVYAAAVILQKGHMIEGVNDSKKLSEKKREMLYDRIISECAAWSVGTASEKEIDEINILQATFLAMKRAVDGLTLKPDFVLVDGNQIPPLDIPCKTLVKGDARCACIAAASIIAKVSRDRYMLTLAEKYPQYEFEKHKGYGTKLHYEKIAQHGLCPAHRRSFLKKALGDEQSR